MPRLPWPPLGRLSAIVLIAAGLLLGAGCATSTAPVQGPKRIAAPRDPTRDVQTRLLEEARGLHQQGQPRSAARVLERWITSYPDSPLLQEARWWLARSYEQSGNLREALLQYRQAARISWDSELGLAARGRIADLEQKLGAGPGPSSKSAAEHTVLFMPSGRIPLGLNLDAWLEGLVKAGVTGIALTAGTEPDPDPGTDFRQGKSQGRPPSALPSAGVYFRTDWAPTVRDVVGQVLPAARRHGLSVYVTVNLRRMDWLDQRMGWRDRWYDPIDRQLKPASSLDLFHPAFQEYLVGLLTDLVRSGVDGLLFRAAPPARMTDGLGAFAVEGFERDFGVKLDPQILTFSAEGTETWASDGRPAPGQSGESSARPSTGQAGPPEPWRWLGWRARESLKILDRLKQAVRKQSSAVQVGLELHPAAVINPVQALVLYREDLLEARRFLWDFYLVGSDRPGTGTATTSTDSGIELSTLANRTIALVGKPGQVWVSTPLKTADPARLAERLSLAVDHSAIPGDVGLWYESDVGVVP